MKARQSGVHKVTAHDRTMLEELAVNSLAWFVLELLEELFRATRRCRFCGRIESERWATKGEGCDCIPF